MAWNAALNNIVSANIYAGVAAASKLPFFANTKWGEEAANANQVTIVSVGDITIGDYSPGTDIVATEGSPTSNILAINQNKYFDVILDDTAKVVGGIEEMYAQKATQKIVLAADAHVLGMATKANFAANWIAGNADAAINLGSVNILDLFDEMAERLNQAGAPEDGRFVSVPPKVYRDIMTRLRGSGLTAQQVTDGVFGGRATMISGLNVVLSNQYAPITGSGTFDYKLLYGHVDSIAAAYVDVQVESFRPEKRFADAIKGLFRYGAKVNDASIGGACYVDAT